MWTELKKLTGNVKIITLIKSIGIYSLLSRCSTARGSISGSAMNKARKSFLFTEGPLKVENKEH